MDVELSVDNGVATLLLNRPDSLNALTPAMMDQMLVHLSTVAEDASIRALLFTGAGRAFCAGADVKGSGGPPKPVTVASARHSMAKYQEVALRLYNLDKPVVCAVRGATVGIAWTYALCADMLLASQTTNFIPAFLMRATVPEGGMVHLLARHCGEFRAKEIMYLNRKVSGEEAAQMGLVSRVVPDDELLPQAQALAAELAAMPTFSVGLTKQLFRTNAGSMEEFLSTERNAIALAVNSEDASEGRQAFRDKRKPDFKGC